MSDKQYNAEHVAGTVTVTSPAANGTANLTLNGELKYLAFTFPDLDDTGFGTFEVQQNGHVFYTSGSISESTTTGPTGTSFPLVGTQSIVVQTDGTQSADASISFDLWYEA